MKFDIVTDTFAPDVNGVAMTLGRLTDGLRKRGHRVHVIHTGISAKPGETCAAAVNTMTAGWHWCAIRISSPL